MIDMLNGFKNMNKTIYIFSLFEFLSFSMSYISVRCSQNNKQLSGYANNIIEKNVCLTMINLSEC